MPRGIHRPQVNPVSQTSITGDKTVDVEELNSSIETIERRAILGQSSRRGSHPKVIVMDEFERNVGAVVPRLAVGSIPSVNNVNYSAVKELLEKEALDAQKSIIK